MKCIDSKVQDGFRILEKIILMLYDLVLDFFALTTI